MSRRLVHLLAVPVGLTGLLAASSALAAGSGVIWHKASELPGIGSLNKGGNSALLALSCVSPGNCAAGGYYFGARSRRETLVADQRNGTWHPALPVPGIGALNTGG